MATRKELVSLIISLEGQIKDLKQELGKATTEVDKFAKKNKNVLNEIRKNWLGYTAAVAATVFALKKLAAPFGNLV